MSSVAPIPTEAFLSIAKTISSAALDPLGWKGVLSEMCRAVDGVRTHFILFDAAVDYAHRSYYEGYDPAIMDDYDRHWGDQNAWAPGFAAQRTGQVVSSQTMLPDEALKKTEFYHGWVVPQEDVALGGGAILDKSAETAFLIGGNVRRKDGIDVQSQWLETLTRAMPLLRQAVEINKALSGLRLETHLLRRGQEPRGAAVMVMRRDRRLVQANSVAEQLLEHGVLARTDTAARVRLSDYQADQALSRSLLARPGMGAQVLRLTGPDGTERIAHTLVMGEEILDSISFLARQFVTLPLVVLIVMPADTPRPNARLMREFGLTAAEAEVAAAFARGQTPEEIAEARQSRISTVRQQIKVAMAKTDTRRQVELALLVSTRLNGLR